MVLNKLVKFTSLLIGSEVNIFPKKQTERLNKIANNYMLEITPGMVGSFVVVFSIIFEAIIIALGVLFGMSLFLIIGTILIPLVLYLYGSRIIYSNAKEVIQQIEQYLPLFLPILYNRVQLAGTGGFLQAIEDISESNMCGALSREANRILRERAVGVDLNTALANSAERIESELYRRVISTLRFHLIMGIQKEKSKTEEGKEYFFKIVKRLMEDIQKQTESKIIDFNKAVEQYVSTYTSAGVLPPALITIFAVLLSNVISPLFLAIILLVFLPILLITISNALKRKDPLGEVK